VKPEGNYLKNKVDMRGGRSGVLRIVAAYAIFSCLWIYTSDTVLGWLSDRAEVITRLAIFKGVLFVAVTAALLYKLIRHYTQYMDRSLREMTERVKAEQEANFFRKLVETAGDPVYAVCPAEGWKMVYANQAACDHYGYPLEELLRMTVPEWDPLFDTTLGDARFEDMKGQVRTFESVHRTASGKLVPVEITSSYVEYNGREMAAGHFRDISGRKSMETALRESEAKYRMLYQDFEALFNGLPDALVVISPDMKIVWSNRTAAELLRLQPSELQGRNCCELWDGHEIACRKCSFTRCFATGSVEMQDIQTSSGLNLELRGVPVKNDKGEVVKVIGIARDVTDQRNLEQQLHHSQKMDAVGQLAGGIAHDFNNILTAVIGYASLLSMKMPQDDPLRQYADNILSSSEKAAMLVQSLLTFSRKKVVNTVPMDLNEALRTGERLFRSLLREDIELTVALHPSPLPVMGESLHLEQVLMNLLSNARDAMPDGGTVAITTQPVTMDEGFTHTHGYGKPGVYACLSITDSGIGMDENTKEKIFEPFFTTKEVGKGTGLGLATTYGIVKQHHGYINLYSELRHGTTFKIYLPLLTSSGGEKETPHSPFPSGGDETILLAEDAENIRNSNKEILQNFGYTVIEAQDGDDAIEKFMNHRDRVDLLILDVIMPKKSGKEVFDALKAIDKDIKVLFMSGYTADVVVRKGVDEKDLQFISKPASPKVLLYKIREILDA
jgi:PAS domain S-box-containing protein